MKFVYCLCAIVSLVLSIESAVKIHLLPSPKTEHGEGLHWDVETQSLYYNSASENDPALMRYDYRKHYVYTAKIKNRNHTSVVIPIRGKKNQFAVAIGRNIEIIYWDGYSKEAEVIRTVINIEPSDFYSTNVFNDAKADPCGRFFGGTLRMSLCKDDPKIANASFVSYTKKRGLIRWRSDVYISNGLTWNKKKRKFYYIDSCEQNIKEYDWNPKNGAICNERIAYNFRKNGKNTDLIPDGMTIDRDGLLWVSLIKGGSVLAIDPIRHKIVRNITMPAYQVTAAVFGGPYLDELFVSTAGRHVDFQTGKFGAVPEAPLAGYLFKITGLKTQGYAPYELHGL